MLELYPAVLLRRYKRFLADIRLPDGTEVTIHCPNTGSMKNCVVPDSPCWYSVSDSKTRKYPQTLELVTTPGGHIAGINTGRTNALVEEALRAGRIPDAVSERGSKHLRELMAMVAQGHKAALLFCVQHTGITSVRAAAHIDPLYAATLQAAQAAGVMLLAYATAIDPVQHQLVLDRALPVRL